MSAPSTSENWFCSVLAREAGEPVIGTATRVDGWFLLEYTGAWNRNAFDNSELPVSVKEHVAAARKAVPNTRIELIKQEGRQPAGDIAFFVALSRESDPVLYRFTLARYEDLLALDLTRIAAGDAAFADHLVADERALFLICTNGRHDQCCAKFGLPVYHELARGAGEQVWQGTHLGGHRLGPNVVNLPSGIYYGRVQPADVAAILKSDSIHLKNLRGRSCYDPHIQAAETFLRQQTGVTGLAAFKVAGVKETGPDAWEVRFASPRDGKIYAVSLSRQDAGYQTYSSCGDTQKADVKVFVASAIESS